MTLTTEEFLEQAALASPAPDAARLLFGRPPVTKDELWWTVYAMWGVRLPRQQICIDHQAPFDAFADAYFGNKSNWALWYGSRGTGKSYMLAILALTKAVLLEIEVTILGGSMAQSQNVQEHVANLMLRPNAPTQMVKTAIQSKLEFVPGNTIEPLPASQKTVRGPHPHMTCLDEIDEMDKKVYDAAMGQPLEKENARGVVMPEMTVASSTWQNPIGTFQAVIDEAREKGLPVFTWCWREVLRTAENPSGWMTPEFIQRKKDAVPAEMFRVEYDLGEPAGDARAFDLEKVNEYFVEYPEPIFERHAGNDDEWRWEEPKPGATYAAGADWAKMRDKTVIGVLRTDVTPRRLVYLRRVNRQDWPAMIGYFNDAVNEYQAASAHDATGLGNVVHDLVDERTLKVEMVAGKRRTLLTEYIADFEHGAYLLPLGTTLKQSHRATTVDAVWTTGQKVLDDHLPDDVAMMAIAHRAAERVPPAAAAQGVPRTPDGAKAYRGLNPESEHTRRDGDVRVQEVEDGIAAVRVADYRDAEDQGYFTGF